MARIIKLPEVSYAKLVKTKDMDGNQNGYLLELQKNSDGHTTSYLTSALPGCFKGFHLHRKREANYVCLQGEPEIIVYFYDTKNNKIDSRTFKLIAGDKLNIPTYMPTAFKNDGHDEAWIVNFPSPPYDPDLTDEQVDFTEEECREGKFLNTLKEDGEI